MDKFHYVYIILSLKDKSLYKGCTSDLVNRFNEHNKGLVESTSDKRPWKLIYYEACLNKKDAYNREKYFKMGGGRRYIQKRPEDYLVDHKI